MPPDFPATEGKPSGRKRAGCVLGAVLGVGFLLGACLVPLARDIPPIDDSDLAVPAPSFDPQQNPYPEFRDIDEIPADREIVIRDLRKAFLDREGEIDPADPGEQDGLLEEYAGELARFDRYAGMTDWWQDEELSVSSKAPHLGAWHILAQLRQVEVGMLVKEGKLDEAIAKSVSAIRFGRGLQEARGSLIQYLFGLTIAEMGRGGVVEAIDTGQLTDPQLESLAAELDAIEFDPEALADVLRVEYRVFKKVIDDVADGKVGLEGLAEGESNPPRRGGASRNPFVFKRHKTHLLFAEAYRKMIAEVPLIRKDSPRQAMEDARHAAAEGWARKIASGNTVGRILFSIGIPAIDGMLDNAARQQAAHDLIRVRVAMERFRRAEGKWPQELGELVPDFIPAIPIDPMDGFPLRYDAASGVIYSVGKNFTDEGGVPPKNPGQLRDRDEIVLELQPEK